MGIFGTKDLLAIPISQATGIGTPVLTHPAWVSTYTVAERMSWASKRSTTREEDIAYCRLGLFQINMPPLYGEGERAFIRLQDEILKIEEDYSLFAWASPPPPYERPPISFISISSPPRYTGLLAQSPSYFSENPEAMKFAPRQLQNNLKSYNWQPKGTIFKPRVDWLARNSPLEPPMRTARGIRLSLPVIQDPDSDYLLAYTHCTAKYDERIRILCLVLRLFDANPETDIYKRDFSGQALRWLDYDDTDSRKFAYKTIYVESLAVNTWRRYEQLYPKKISENARYIGILVIGTPHTNIGPTAQVEFLGFETHAFELVHQHEIFLVGLWRTQWCKIFRFKAPEGTRKECELLRMSSIQDVIVALGKVWNPSIRSADSVSLGGGSWVNVLSKEAPKTWTDKHRGECKKRGWRIEPRDRVILLYIWADCLVEYLRTRTFYDSRDCCGLLGTHI